MNKKVSVILFLTFLSFLIGCTNSQFNSNYKQFKESYITASDFIEKDTDYLKALKGMNVNAYETELKKMKVLMDKMDTKAKSKNEKGIYGNVKNYYEELEFLLYAAKNLNSLTIDEKANLYTEVISILSNRKDIKEGKV